MTAVIFPTSGPLIRCGLRWFGQVRRHGVARGAYSVARKLALLPGANTWAWICGSDVLRQRLSQWSVKGRVPRGMRVQQAHAQDLAEVAQFFGSQQRVKDRYDQGHRCFVASSQAGIGAGVWLALGPNAYAEDLNDLRCLCRFPAGVGWLFDGKGKKLGAWGSLMARLPDLLGELGIEEVFALIEWNNWRSLDSHRSLGYQNVGHIACVSLRPFLWRGYAAPRQPWRPLPGSLGKLEIVLPS